MKVKKNAKKYKKRGFVYHENRKYHRQTELKDGWRVKCSKKHCPGKGSLSNSGEFSQKPHEAHASWCEEEPGIEAFEELKQNYLAEVPKSFERPRNIFDKHVREMKLKYPNMPPVQYGKFKNSTTYAKREVNPPQPKNLDAMGQHLQDKEYEEMLHYNWKPSSHFEVERVYVEDAKHNISVSLVFGDREWSKHVLSFIEHTVHGFTDGTFRIKPSKMKVMQVLKFEVSCFCQGVPIAYALMERKTTNDYEAVIRCIIAKFAPELKDFLVKVHTDFEAAEVNGWQRVLSAVQFVYCVFHFDQIQWKNGKRLGILKTKKRLKKENLSEIEEAEKEEEDKILDEIKETLRLIFALPLLPLSQVVDEALFDRIIARLSEKAKQKMSRYNTYFKGNWLSTKHPPEEWNVSEEIYKTNNFSESGNRLMNSFFQQKHPAPWPFVRALVAYHQRVTSEFRGRVGKISLEKETLINEYKKLLLSGKMQRLEFLLHVSAVTNKNHDRVFKDEVELALQEEDEGAEEEEDEGREGEENEEKGHGERESEEKEAPGHAQQREEGKIMKEGGNNADENPLGNGNGGILRELSLTTQFNANLERIFTEEFVKGQNCENETEGETKENRFNNDNKRYMTVSENNQEKRVEIDALKSRRHPKKQVHNSVNHEEMTHEGEMEMDGRNPQYSSGEVHNDAKRLTTTHTKVQKRSRKQALKPINREGGEMEIEDTTIKISKPKNLKGTGARKTLRM